MTRNPTRKPAQTLTVSLGHALVGVALLAGLAACSGSHGATNKTGAHVPPDTTTIHLAMPDIDDADGRYFAAAVERRSQGSLKVDVDDSFDSADTAKEARLAPALTAGSVDAAYLPARDWASPGLPYFQALAAPFSVTTAQAMQAVATSDFARAALDSLKSKNVVGLALVPVEPRQLLSTRPLVTASDFGSASIRVVLNPALSAAVTALGATPADVPESSKVSGLLADGTLTAAETSPLYALSNHYVTEAHFLTSFGLYAKFQVIGVGTKVWSGLDDQQRSAFIGAAADTVKHAQDGPDLEAKELAAVCTQTAVVTETSRADLDAIVRQAEPDTSEYARAAAELAAVPGTGPQPAAVAVPSGCTVASDATSATAALARLQRKSGHQPTSQTATIPNGTYLTTDTVADWRAGGQYGADWNTAITWTWVFKDGAVRATQRPDFADQGPCSGRYQIDGNQLRIHWTGGTCTELSDEVTHWSYFDGRLTFTLVNVADTASRVIYTAHPWRKVD